MHVLHISVEIDDTGTHISLNNLAREDSNNEEKKIIESFENLIGEVLKRAVKEGDTLREIN